jgi:hypothetical protein
MFGIRYIEKILQKFMYLITKKLKGNILNNEIEAEPTFPITSNAI